MASRKEQGTGKHPHKNTAEPYSYSKEEEGGQQSRSQSHAGSKPGSSREQQQGGADRHEGKSQQSGSGGDNRQQASGSGDLKEREYRDEQGNIHHHTKSYMEQHKKE